VLNTKENIKGLDQRALCITSTIQPEPILWSFHPITITNVIVHTPGKTSMTHILAASQERPKLVEEDSRIVVLVHSFQSQCQVA
jgi:phosphoenolpyruvate-protein kinase (PTS system EI component)